MNVIVTHELTADDIRWTLDDAIADDVAADPVDVAVDALLDAEVYRTLAQTAIHTLAALQVRYDRLRAIQAEQRERAA